MTEIKGIRSINNRLQEVETRLKNVSFKNDLLSNIKTKQEEAKIKKLSKIKTAFLDNISQEIDIENNSNYVQIVVFTIKWIEINIGVLSDLLGVGLSSDLKLDTAIEFIKIVIDGFNNEFIQESINSLCSLVFPKPTVKRRKSISFKRSN